MTEHNPDQPEDSITHMMISINGQVMPLSAVPLDFLDLMHQELTEKTEELPEEMRQRILNAIDIQRAERMLHDEQPNAENDDDEPSEHDMAMRELTWRLGNLLFPDDPHLWQALEILLSLHRAPSEDARLGALHRIHDHIHEAIEAMEHSDESPLDFIVKQFRKQMNEE